MTTQDEIFFIKNKIEKRTATLDDYKKYKQLLLKAGLSEDIISEELQLADFNNYDDFLIAKEQNDEKRLNNTWIFGTLVGLGLGILLYNALKR